MARGALAASKEIIGQGGKVIAAVKKMDD